MFYLKQKPNQGATSLYTNRIIQAIALSLITIFLPIFLLERFGSVRFVLLFFIFYHGFSFFLLAIGARVASRITFKNSLFLSIPFGALYYLSYYLFDISPLFFTICIIFFVNLFRMFYWVPFHSDFALFTAKNNRAKTLALFQSIGLFISIFLPVLSGFIIAKYGFGILFLIAMVVYMTSAVPLLFIPKTYERFDFTYFETFRVLFHPKERRLLLSSLADGAQDIVSVVVWPIFIWQLLSGDFKSVGILTSIIILATIIIQLLFADFADKYSKKKILYFGSVMYSFGWIVKMFVETSFQIFVAGTYHNVSAIFMRTPYDNLIYEKAADLGHYVDEYTVLREMSLSLGRVLMLIFLILLFSVASLQWAFVLAAIFSLIMNAI